MNMIINIFNKCFRIYNALNILSATLRFFVTAAVTDRLCSLYKTLDNSGCTTYSCFYTDCAHRTVSAASPAFHTGISIDYFYLFVTELKNPMRTHGNAHTASDTFIDIQFQGDDIFEILELHITSLDKPKYSPKYDSNKRRYYLQRNCNSHFFFYAGKRSIG
jgi:hypothetical protein